MSDPLEIDGWITQLGQCKQLVESDVKVLCDKVRIRSRARLLSIFTLLLAVRHRLEKYLWRSPMYNQYDVQ